MGGPVAGKEPFAISLVEVRSGEKEGGTAACYCMSVIQRDSLSEDMASIVYI